MKNVLVIDDEKACLTTTVFVLNSKGYNVLTAESGVDGLNFLRNKSMKIDLVLLDLMMPDIYGLEFLKEMMKDSNTKDIPVILHTGSSNEEEIKEAVDKLGAKCCVRKPYKRNILLSAVDSVLTDA